MHQSTILAALPVLFALHLGSLRHVVEAEEAFDAEIGLWSEVAWRVQAQQKLHDVRGHVALIIIDPDHAGQEREILRSIESGLGPSDAPWPLRHPPDPGVDLVGRAEAGRFLTPGSGPTWKQAAFPPGWAAPPRPTPSWKAC